MTDSSAPAPADARADVRVEVDGYSFDPERAYDPVTHHWVRTGPEGVSRIGLDALTADSYGALAQLVISSVGTLVARGEEFGSLEAAKYVGPLIAPVSGRIATVNAAVLENPELVLRDPYGTGWLIELDLTSRDEDEGLLTGDAARAWYAASVREHRANGLVAEDGVAE